VGRRSSSARVSCARSSASLSQHTRRLLLLHAPTREWSNKLVGSPVTELERAQKAHLVFETTPRNVASVQERKQEIYNEAVIIFEATPRAGQKVTGAQTQGTRCGTTLSKRLHEAAVAVRSSARRRPARSSHSNYEGPRWRFVA
jgi:ubiquinone biosynthesis protein COQ9